MLGSVPRARKPARIGALALAACCLGLWGRPAWADAGLVRGVEVLQRLFEPTAGARTTLSAADLLRQPMAIRVLLADGDVAALVAAHDVPPDVAEVVATHPELAALLTGLRDIGSAPAPAFAGAASTENAAKRMCGGDELTILNALQTALRGADAAGTELEPAVVVQIWATFGGRVPIEDVHRIAFEEALGLRAATVPHFVDLFIERHTVQRLVAAGYEKIPKDDALDLMGDALRSGQAKPFEITEAFVREIHTDLGGNVPLERVREVVVEEAAALADAKIPGYVAFFVRKRTLSRLGGAPGAYPMSSGSK